MLVCVKNEANNLFSKKVQKRLFFSDKMFAESKKALTFAIPNEGNKQNKI